MKILWVIAGGLWPLNTGGRQRSFNILSQLSKSNSVHVITSHGPGDDPEGLKENLPDCKVVSLSASIPRVGSAAFAVALFQSWFSRYPVDALKSRIPSLQREVLKLLSTG